MSDSGFPVRRLRILVVAGYYLPGYRAGGPVRTLANMVEELGEEFQFDILAADHDLGEKQPYSGITPGVWAEVGKGRVMYLSRNQMSFWAWRRLFRKLDFDVIYLNSYFSTFTVQTLLLRRFGLFFDRPIILAPRGEFSPEALALKRWKKLIYMTLASALRLYRGITWQASSEFEDIQIRPFRHCKDADQDAIHLAPDLCSSGLLDDRDSPVPRLPKRSGSARILFISRIARMKNLDFALRLLEEIQNRIEFDIYGPIEDADYWRECETIIEQLPANVQVSYRGVVPAEEVPALFARGHLFLFPTRGENFGHVVIEALGAGCPVLLSDRTPWRGLTAQQIGWDIPLEEPKSFGSALAKLVAMNQSTFNCWSMRCKAYAQMIAKDKRTVEANRQLFLDA
jgi:glycosyltransferase involved in cell wall biosynthesis